MLFFVMLYGDLDVFTFAGVTAFDVCGMGWCSSIFCPGVNGSFLSGIMHSLILGSVVALLHVYFCISATVNLLNTTANGHCNTCGGR